MIAIINISDPLSITAKVAFLKLSDKLIEIGNDAPAAIKAKNDIVFQTGVLGGLTTIYQPTDKVLKSPSAKRFIPFVGDLINFAYTLTLRPEDFINPIKNKEDGLKNYYYSIAIENDNTDNYFSEKILDCFMTCTIPIYWGTEYVNEVFNSKGILNLKTFTDLSEIKKLDKTYYCDNIDAVVENYFLAQKENRYLNHLLKNILFKLYIKNYQ